MIILGIDPGLRVTGYGVIEIVNHKAYCRDYGGIYNREKSKPIAEKLLKIYNEICDVVNTFKPQHCAIEDVFYHENSLEGDLAVRKLKVGDVVTFDVEETPKGINAINIKLLEE